MGTTPIDIWLTDPREGDFPIPYMATFSPMLRLFLMIPGHEKVRERVKQEIEGVVRFFDENGEGMGLKVPFVDNTTLMRQIDLRTEPGGPILLKTFTSWEDEKKRWRVLAEGPGEDHWEKGQVQSGVN